MPVRGFKQGDAVLTPSGKRATVVGVTKKTPELVEVRYEDAIYPNRRFRAAALRFHGK